jgi:hypothetical protein
MIIFFDMIHFLLITGQDPQYVKINLITSDFNYILFEILRKYFLFSINVYLIE